METARKATFQEAKRAFANGERILVLETPRGSTYPVGPTTTTHDKTRTTFAELHAEVKMWRNRYPYQTFYIVEGE
jgi:hypothetical protein